MCTVSDCVSPGTRRVIVPLGRFKLDVAVSRDLWWRQEGGGRLVSLFRISVWRPEAQPGWVLSLVMLHLKVMLGKI